MWCRSLAALSKQANDSENHHDNEACLLGCSRYLNAPPPPSLYLCVLFICSERRCLQKSVFSSSTTFGWLFGHASISSNIYCWWISHFKCSIRMRLENPDSCHNCSTHLMKIVTTASRLQCLPGSRNFGFFLFFLNSLHHQRWFSIVYLNFKFYSQCFASLETCFLRRVTKMLDIQSHCEI